MDKPVLVVSIVVNLIVNLVVNTFKKAEDLMPRDIRSSEPRHWMVFGQLVMPVQCCAGAPAARRRAPAQHCTGMTNWPNTIQCLG